MTYNNRTSDIAKSNRRGLYVSGQNAVTLRAQAAERARARRLAVVPNAVAALLAEHYVDGGELHCDRDRHRPPMALRVSAVQLRCRDLGHRLSRAQAGEVTATLVRLSLGIAARRAAVGDEARRGEIAWAASMDAADLWTGRARAAAVDPALAASMRRHPAGRRRVEGKA